MADRIALPDHIRAFIAAPGRYATLATVDPDGAPRQAATWYTFEPDQRITLNSREGRRWPANLRRDPRLALAVIDMADGERSVALMGRVVEVIEDRDQARAEAVAMARQYQPDDPDAGAEFLGQERVGFRVVITAIHDHLS